MIEKSERHDNTKDMGGRGDKKQRLDMLPCLVAYSFSSYFPVLDAFVGFARETEDNSDVSVDCMRKRMV